MPGFLNPQSAGSKKDPYEPVPTSGEGSSDIMSVLQNRYVLIGPLGQGGMGTVFLAQDTRLSNRLCVVKKLRLDNFSDTRRLQAMEFFEREMVVLSQLKHSNVVHVQDYFQENGNYFLVMEYVEGDNLQQLLRKRTVPFNERQVLEWTLTILDVLQYLHNHKPPVIYRDIKPSNIMLGTTDGIKLVDFGIARPYNENSENTHVVSAGYSPPEQYWGAADPRSDIYALGATMYYLLTGKEPIALQSCAPKKRNAKVSDYIDKIVQRATSQDVWLRYQTIAEMEQALADMPLRQSLPVPPAYVLVACFSAIISVAAAAFAFLNFADQNQSNSIKTIISKTLGSNSGTKITQADNKPIALDAEQISKTKKGMTNAWYIPLELATLADGEEMITDPDGLKTMSSVNNAPAKNQPDAWTNRQY